MTQINPYLNFNGNCREAMIFYKECLGGELYLQTVGDSPLGAQCAFGIRHNIVHSSLTRKTLILMASDMIGPEGLNTGNNISLALSCSTEEEINHFFCALSAGGKIIEPLNLQFWGAMFGVLKDKFGVQWMLTYDKTNTKN